MAGALAVGTAECVAEAPDGPAVAGDAQPATIQTTARSVSTRTSPIRRSAAAVRAVPAARPSAIHGACSSMIRRVA